MACFQLKMLFFWVGKKHVSFAWARNILGYIWNRHNSQILSAIRASGRGLFTTWIFLKIVWPSWPWQWYKVLRTFTECSFADPLLSDWAILSSLSNQPCYWQHSWDTWAAACKWCNSRGYHSILVVCVLWIIHFIDKVGTVWRSVPLAFIANVSLLWSRRNGWEHVCSLLIHLFSFDTKIHSLFPHISCPFEKHHHLKGT